MYDAEYASCYLYVKINDYNRKRCPSLPQVNEAWRDVATGGCSRDGWKAYRRPDDNDATPCISLAGVSWHEECRSGAGGCCCTRKVFCIVCWWWCWCCCYVYTLSYSPTLFLYMSLFIHLFMLICRSYP